MADYRLTLRRDTAANWTSANPTLAQGEPGFETDTLNLKVGDGATAWNDLAYYTPTNALTSNRILLEARASEAVSAGDVLSYAGVSGSKVLVKKADASDPAYDDRLLLGVATTSAALNADLDVLEFGVLSSFDTSGFTAGDTLWLDDHNPASKTKRLQRHCFRT